MPAPGNYQMKCASVVCAWWPTPRELCRGHCGQRGLSPRRGQLGINVDILRGRARQSRTGPEEGSRIRQLRERVQYTHREM